MNSASTEQYVTKPPCNVTTPAAVQIPPPADFYGLGARVEHVLASREDRLSLIIAEALQLPQSFVEALVEFGAVYTCPVPPTPPAQLEASLPAETQEAMRSTREAAAAAAGAAERGRRDPLLWTPQRVCEDVTVPRYAYIRVHVHPKRFPAAYVVRWEERILADLPECVVLNKPPGVPVAPTAVGHPRPLLITHRLDQATEGVVVLGKTPEFVSRFNALISRGDNSLRKFYHTLTAAPPPQGPLVHYLSVSKRQPGLPSHTIAHEEQQPGSARCELRVLQVREVQLTGTAAQRWGASAYEGLLELITGKTHQIRAQLSAVGCPLMGDELYRPLASAQLRQRLYDNDPALEVVDAQGRRLLNEPVGAIGLQACRLVVGDGACMGLEAGVAAEFEAGAPWWRAGDLL
ncbi:hypothetical protein N2152v2_009439 [Parachlorella kessleri]